MKEIKLNQGKVALVDDDDFERINKFKWFLGSGDKNHVMRRFVIEGKRRTISLHRLLLGLKIGDKSQVDHANGNGRDNRRRNLRICNKSQNQWNRRKQCNNTSGYKGVYWLKERQKWRAHIQYKGKKMNLGSFEDRESAAITYNEAALKYHGEFAKLNTLPSCGF